MFYNQSEYNIRLEWGLKGVEALGPISDVVIIIDVLSFSTCVDIATSNSAAVYPYKWKDETAADYAREQNATLAIGRSVDKLSLSPTSLTSIEAGTKLVLPSPNGSAITFAANSKLILCGCLRNATAVANYAMQGGKTIAIIPAGEKWPDGTLRPAFEDQLAAGAIISSLKGTLSPEAKAAMASFLLVREKLEAELLFCSSSKELIEMGFKNDVLLAAAYNSSSTVPVLVNKAYIKAGAPG